MIEIGKEYSTNRGDKFIVIEKLKSYRHRIKFLDEFCYEKEVISQYILSGVIRNPFNKSVYNVGYMGIGEYDSNSMGGKIHVVWSGMVERCYSERWKLKYPSYTNSTMCTEWLNFQNFAKWYDNNYPHHIKDVKFELDKDLKQNGIVNKIYSPETCLIIPKIINGFMVNVQSDNTSGYTGVHKLKDRENRWTASTRDQTTKLTKVLGVFKTIEEAIECYNIHRKIRAEELKDWVRELNYLDESIIQLIK